MSYIVILMSFQAISSINYGFSQDFSGTKDAPPPSKKFAPYAHAEPKKIVNPAMG